MGELSSDVLDGRIDQFRPPSVETLGAGFLNASALRLLADIGGTHARFALQRPGAAPRHVRVFRVREYRSLEQVLDAYRGATGRRPRQGAFAVASPVDGDVVRLSNASWTFSAQAVSRRLGLERLRVINDFSAVALGVPRLRGDDLDKIGRGRRRRDGAVGVLGPGTGLGVSGLVPSAAGPIALASEGGHVTIGAADGLEALVFQALRRDFGHVSAERVLSGPGLVNLYHGLCAVEGRRPRKVTPDWITKRAGTDLNSGEALQLFARVLGTAAADLALILGATGGIFIAGGIVPRLRGTFPRAAFRRRFEAKGRFQEFLGRIPTYLIRHPYPAFVGLAALLDGAGDAPGFVV